MKYRKPDYTDQFYCTAESCPATCAAPLDMTWTKSLGAYCEGGLSLACPRAAQLILLHQDPTHYSTHTDDTPGPALDGETGGSGPFVRQAFRP